MLQLLCLTIKLKLFRTILDASIVKKFIIDKLSLTYGFRLIAYYSALFYFEAVFSKYRNLF